MKHTRQAILTLIALALSCPLGTCKPAGNAENLLGTKSLSVSALPAGAKGPSSLGNEFGNLLHGHASMDDPRWQQHFRAGTQALQQRLYTKARVQLGQALDELRRRHIEDARTLATENALAQAYLGEERPVQAKRLLDGTCAKARGARQNEQLAIALGTLSECLLLDDQLKKAEAVCREAISLSEHVNDTNHAHVAHAWQTLGKILATENLHDASIEANKHAVKILDGNASSSRYELGQALYGLALAEHAGGQTQEAGPHFDRAFALLDKETLLNNPLPGAPKVSLRWEDGNPRARQIADPEYPLKYVLVDKLRVAAAAVRSENVIAVIVSLANCGPTRIPIAVGPVAFMQLKPKHRPFDYVPPQLLDIPLEEEHIVELTWRRRWLNHIQKARFIPGYLKNRSLDVDNFFSNNTWGPYGNWPTIARSETPMVTREQFYFGDKEDTEAQTADFLSHTALGFRPTYLEPGEAKTGLVFFRQERFDKANLKIVVGNVVVNIPFDTAGPR